MDRINAFKTITKTNKSVNSTFITTYGISENNNTDIVNASIKLDNLVSFKVKEVAFKDLPAMEKYIISRLNETINNVINFCVPRISISQ